MAFWNKQQLIKSANISVTDLDAFLDILVNGDGGNAWGSAYYKGVIKKIASTVRIIPRRITTIAGDEIEAKELPFDISIDDILAQSSTAVNRLGRAYWGLDIKGSNISGVRWYNPITIAEDYHPGRGLVGFTRQNSEEQLRKIYYKYNKETKRVDYGDNGGLGWVWSLGMNETGPGDTLDDEAGLPASLLQYADLMMEKLFKRGGINKWVAFADQTPPPEEKERIRSAINRMLGGGVSDSSTFEVLSNLLTMQQIGTNPKDLGMEEINKGNKNDVSAVALTPQMIIDPSLASNRSVYDGAYKEWINTVIVPHTETIINALNHHVFIPSGYMIELMPESMGINQQNETERSAAWKSYVDAGANPDTVATMLGLDVPEGMSLMLPMGIETDKEGVTTIIDQMETGAIEPAQVLNGAQISSAIQIVDAFSRGLFPRDVAVNMVVRFFNISREEAETLIPKSSQTTQAKAKQLEAPDDDIKSEQWKDERRQFRAWYKKRLGQDITQFKAHHIDHVDMLEIQDELLRDSWEVYP